MGKRTPFSFIRDQYASIPPISSLQIDLSQRVVVVVGASSGIGLETARHLASMHPRELVLGCRNARRGNDALECMFDLSSSQTLDFKDYAIIAVRRSTGYCSGKMIVLDLMSFESIRTFVDQLVEEYQTIDLLVLNAGINTEIYKRSTDGYESVYDG